MIITFEKYEPDIRSKYVDDSTLTSYDCIAYIEDMTNLNSDYDYDFMFWNSKNNYNYYTFRFIFKKGANLNKIAKFLKNNNLDFNITNGDNSNESELVFDISLEQASEFADLYNNTKNYNL